MFGQKKRKITKLVSEFLLSMPPTSIAKKEESTFRNYSMIHFIDFGVAYQSKQFIIQLCEIICPERLVFYRCNVVYTKYIHEMYKIVNNQSEYKFTIAELLEFIISWLLLSDLVRYLRASVRSFLKDIPMIVALNYATDNINNFRIPDFQTFDCDYHYPMLGFNTDFPISTVISGKMSIKKSSIAFYNKIKYNDDFVNNLLNCMLGKLLK